MDVPNERSSHSRPTPRGGGLGIVLSTALCWLVLGIHGWLEWPVVAALLAGGLPIALVGFVDDKRSVPAVVRLLVHLAAAVLATCILGAGPVLHLMGAESVPEWVSLPLTILCIVWATNLFNFMDGIDGIAGSEAAFIGGAGAAVAIFSGAGAGISAGAAVLAAASCGFLLWNWPPARIFMGDVGSGYVGFSIAVLALAAARNEPWSILSWLVLAGIFFVDATVTLIRRMLNGEHVLQPHRAHAYQKLARRFGSHRAVTLATIVVNILFLLPCALLVTAFPHRAAVITAAALLPIVVATIAAGAGVKDAP